MQFIIVVRSDFRSKSCFSCVIVYPGLAMLGELDSDGTEFLWVLLHMILLNIFLYMGFTKAWAPVPVFAIVIPVNFLLVRFVFKHKKL